MRPQKLMSVKDRLQCAVENLIAQGGFLNDGLPYITNPEKTAQFGTCLLGAVNLNKGLEDRIPYAAKKLGLTCRETATLEAGYMKQVGEWAQYPVDRQDPLYKLGAMFRETYFGGK